MQRDVERVARAHEAGRLLATTRCRAHRRASSAGCRRCRRGGRRAARSRTRSILRPVREVLEELAVVDDVRGSPLFMSYGWFGDGGRMSRSSGQRRSGSSPRSRDRWLLEVVRGQERQQVADVVEARLLVGRRRTWRRRTSRRGSSRRPAPRAVTSSPVTVFTTSGPVMNMWLDSRTMKMKSVIAGLSTPRRRRTARGSRRSAA